MPLLQKNSSNFGTKNSPKYNSPLLNVRREDVLYRDDIKVSFAYALIGISAIGILAGFGYMWIQQLKK